MEGFLWAAIRTLAVPEGGPCSPLSTEHPPSSIQTSPRPSNPPLSAPPVTKTESFAFLDLASTESHSDAFSPSHNLLPAASISQSKQESVKLAGPTSSVVVIPATAAVNHALESVVEDNLYCSSAAATQHAREDTESLRSPSPDFSSGDFHFVPLLDANENEEWQLIPEELKSLTGADSTADFSAESLLDSLNNNAKDQFVTYEKADSESTSDQESESLKSFESHEFQCSEDSSSLFLVPTQKSSPSSDNEDIGLPEAGEDATVDDSDSDCSGIGFRELFNDPLSEELDWEDDHFHDCGDEFCSEMNESFYSDRDSEPLLPLEEDSSCDEECLALLFYEEEYNPDNKILDVVEELQPTDFGSIPSGYPVKDLPILEGNFFHLADTPPYEDATDNRGAHARKKAMFLFEIPGKFKEESVVPDIGADVITSFISGQEFGKCDIVFGDFDYPLPPTSLDAQDSPDTSSPSAPQSPRATPSLSLDKSMSLSSLPSSEAILSSSSDCSCATCPSPTLSSEFFPCSDNLSTEHDVDQLDSLEERCFKLYHENDVEASFDCFPMRLQSARKVDFRGCGTRKTRRRRKRW